MTGLTRWVLRHKLIVAGFWLLAAMAGAVNAAAATHRMTDSFSLPGAGIATNDKILAIYHGAGGQDPLVAVVTVPPGHSTASPATTAQAAKILDAARVTPAIRLIGYQANADRVFLTGDGRREYALAFTPPDGSGGTALAATMKNAMRAAAPPGWNVALTGNRLLSTEKPEKKGTGVLAATMLGGLGALAVLLFVFASLLALLPLVIAAVSVLATFLLVLGLTAVTSVSQIVTFLIALIGLGVAIDYSLLVVTRWREERARLAGSGHGPYRRPAAEARAANYAAVEAAMAHAGRSVVFSGLTVAAGLLALAVLPVGFLRSTGFAGIFVPLVSVAVSVTLLPVILATAGPRLDWPRLRTEGRASRPWTAWARFVYRHKWVSAAAGASLLAVLIVPALAMNVGMADSASTAAPGPARTTMAELVHGGAPAGILTPLQVLVRGDATAASAVATAARHVPGIAAAFPTGYRRAGTALVTAIPAVSTGSPAGLATVAAIRRDLAASPQVIGIGGSGPAVADFSNAVYGNFPLMLTLIGIATFGLLARAFRSLLLAAKAVLFNLASLGAAFGVITLVWQDGHGSGLWGVAATGDITMWVPLMVFAFLFGLSMDYEVFILTRAREAFDESGSTPAAVVTAIGRTGRLVTSAALVLLLSFVSMSTSGQVDVAILATGLGAGIFIDATVVRCLMVPALVALFGRYNWWLPAWLAWVLRVPPSPLPSSPHPAGTREPALAG
jgi:RND superfamily putative drug exporter